MKSFLIVSALLAAPALAADAPKPPSPGEIVAAAPAEDWVAIPANDLLVMTLAPDRDGKARQVTIQLITPPFSQPWAANVRTLAKAHWWDGLAIVRAQDNYVVQWGDPDGEDVAKAKPLPAQMLPTKEEEYQTLAGPFDFNLDNADLKRALDPYASHTGFVDGWPIAYTRGTMLYEGRPPAVATKMIAWPVHCYGTVGVGRNLSPDAGTGAELYTVIGHAPRHLDRNIAIVGRVIEGIENLSTLPRGTEALGFYATPAERTGIVSIRLASDLPQAEQPKFAYLSTDSDAFARYANARANRRDEFFIVPAGGADVCNIPVPVRRVSAGK